MSSSSASPWWTASCRPQCPGSLAGQDFAEYTRLVESGNTVAHLALEAVERIDAEREAQQQAIVEAEAVAAERDGPPNVDAALDYYTLIVDVIQGRVRRADSARQLGQALASVLAGLWMEVEPDRKRLLVQFALHDQPPSLLPGGVEVRPELRPERAWLPPASLEHGDLESESSHQLSLVGC